MKTQWRRGGLSEHHWNHSPPPPLPTLDDVRKSNVPVLDAHLLSGVFASTIRLCRKVKRERQRENSWKRSAALLSLLRLLSCGCGGSSCSLNSSLIYYKLNASFPVCQRDFHRKGPSWRCCFKRLIQQIWFSVSPQLLLTSCTFLQTFWIFHCFLVKTLYLIKNLRDFKTLDLILDHPGFFLIKSKVAQSDENT